MILLWGVLTFVALQATLNVAMDSWKPQLRYREYGVKLERLRQLTAENPERPLVVMLGSSRTLLGFQAGQLNGMPGPQGKPVAAFNFGFNMVGPLREALHCQDLLRENIHPRLLLVEVMPALLSKPRPNLVAEEHWIQTTELALRDLLRLGPYCSKPHRLWRSWLPFRLCPIYTNRNRLMDYVCRGWEPARRRLETLKVLDPWGWSWAEGTRPCTPETRFHRTTFSWQGYYSSLNNFQTGDGPTQALRDLLQRCREEKITVALVLMPEATQFRGWYPASTTTALNAILADLKRTYGAEIIDARTWVDDQEFADSHHLIPQGAANFTKRLAVEVSRILTRSAGAEENQLARGGN